LVRWEVGGARCHAQRQMRSARANHASPGHYHIGRYKSAQPSPPSSSLHTPPLSHLSPHLKKSHHAPRSGYSRLHRSSHERDRLGGLPWLRPLALGGALVRPLALARARHGYPRRPPRSRQRQRRLRLRGECLHPVLSLVAAHSSVVAIKPRACSTQTRGPSAPTVSRLFSRPTHLALPSSTQPPQCRTWAC
jgi:hypothetical protein